MSEHSLAPSFVVAIGASAGGLEALDRLFRSMPTRTDAAFVVIQHLSPDHKSMMEGLLARHTDIPIVTVRDPVPLRPSCIHLVPSTHNLSVDGDSVVLVPKPERGLNLPIDRFFTDAAAQFGDRLVAVVLSGTGSDGTLGARVVNERGGLVIAQSTDSAKFDGMPRSVVAAGVVDDVLPPEAIAERIARFVQGSGPSRSPGLPTTPEGDPYAAVIRVLSEHSRIDFRAYKDGTVHRRIDRRVAARQLRDVIEYLELLHAEPSEVDALRRDVLIGVTSFFRDPEFFEALAEKVLARIAKAPRAGSEIRVWVPGCSTGEEVYTLAMLLDRAQQEAGVRHTVKVFGTDVEPTHLEIAQAGAYPESILAHIGEDLIEQYFEPDGSRYVIRDRLRRDIVFARHDLTVDPPFTRLDLVSCRNTLIYLRTAAQTEVLRRFQCGLGTGGYLFLGSSESLGPVATDFETVDPRAKLFRCLRAAPLPLELSLTPTSDRGRRATRRVPHAAQVELARARLMDEHLPPSLLVTAERQLVHVYGDATDLLQVPSGGASMDVSRMLAPRLASVTVSVMLRALKTEGAVSGQTTSSDGARSVRIEGQALRRGDEPPLVLLSFFQTPIEPHAEQVAEPLDLGEETAGRLRELEQELASTRENLQATIEELEASNEELQAANEELLASNEERQSTNEELQSVNEELYTVNSEHQEKIEMLRQLNADLDAMARATGFPMLFLDEQLRITRFTPAMTGFVGLDSSDIGRPLAHFTIRLDAPWLSEALQQVLETGRGFEREVDSLASAGEGSRKHLIMRGLPYQTGERDSHSAAHGVVLTLVDITDVEEARAGRLVLDRLPHRVAVVAAGGTVRSVNEAFARFARQHGDPHLRAAGVGGDVFDALRVGVEDSRKLRDAVRAVLDGDQDRAQLVYSSNSPRGEHTYLLDARALGDGGAVICQVDLTPFASAEGRTAP